MEILFGGIEELAIGLICRIVTQLFLMGIIQKEKWIVPHWAFTTIASIYYFINIAPASCLMIGFISLDYIVAINRFFERRAKCKLPKARKTK
jgi:hypothetical protein